MNAYDRAVSIIRAGATKDVAAKRLNAEFFDLTFWVQGHRLMMKAPHPKFGYETTCIFV